MSEQQVTGAALFYDEDQLLIRLAREIAMDHWELEDVLKRYGINGVQWERIKNDKYFNSVLTSELLAWNEVSNTHERSKLKAASVIEDWLPEAHKMLHHRGESLAARVGLATLISKIAGMGASAMNVEGGGGGAERFIININLGENREIRLEKVINAVDNSELGMEEEEVMRAIPERGPLSAHVQSGGGVRQADPFAPVLNPTELVKKW